MKFTIGDPVLVKATDQEGTVRGYIDEKTVKIEVNGIEFPVAEEELSFPYLKWFAKQKKINIGTTPKAVPLNMDWLPKEDPYYKKPKVGTGVHIGFLPQFKFDGFEDAVEKLRVYLINETPLGYRWVSTYNEDEENEQVKQGELKPFSYVYVQDVPFEDFNGTPNFFTEWSLLEKDASLAARIQAEAKLKPKLYFQKLDKMQKAGEPMFTMPLFEQYPRKGNSPEDTPLPFEDDVRSFVQQKLSEKRIMKEVTDPQRPVYELDLHIEKLVSNLKGMSNMEMLDIQLKTFRRYLDLAISRQQHTMIVIHGIGKGTLKEELHEILKHTPEVDTFTARYHHKYGDGATEIFFKHD
jgi:DNA-nicking Smr family endonuclease